MISDLDSLAPELRQLAIDVLFLGDQPHEEEYTRSWRERLFSWPWQPWVKTGSRLTSFALLQQERERVEWEARRVSGISLLMIGEDG